MSDISLPAQRLHDVAQRALDWLQDARHDSARLAAEAESLALRLRRCRRDARRLTIAADESFSLGIYGNARQAKAALLRQLGITPHPVGQPALTVRYHQTPQPATSRLTLLEESDLVGLLFFAAGAQPPDRRQLATGLSALRRQPHAIPAEGVDEDRLLTLWETLSHYHPQLADDPFWPAALALAPVLNIDQRAALFAPLWGERPAFTDLYRQLAHRLQELGSRQFTLTEDIDTLSAVVDGSAAAWLNGEGDRHTVLLPLTEAQTPQRCSQAELALLTAELTLTTPSGDGIFGHPAVLLDIPGVSTACEQTLTSSLLSAKRRWLLHHCSERSQPTLLLVSGAATDRQTVLPAAKALSHWQQGGLPAPDEAGKPDLIWLLTPRSAAAQDYEAAVQRHIGEPGVHWGTLLAQDEDDNRRLLAYLTTAVDNRIRQRRLTKRLLTLHTVLTEAVLGDWLPAADGDERPQQQQVARRLLQTLQARTGVHGELLQQLLPPQEALLHLYQQPAPLTGGEPLGIGIELDLLAPVADGSDISPPTSRFADAAFRLWLEHLRRLADNRALKQQLDIDGRCLSLLADTLINTAWRLGIDRQLRDALMTDSGNAQRQTSLALGVLGDFVAWLGFQHCLPQRRPTSRIQQGQPIFTSPHAPSGDLTPPRLTRLAAAPVNNAAFYIYDWLVGLNTLAADNVGHRAAASLPARQQRRLAQIVAALEDSDKGENGMGP
ncbi:virulence factor SrfC family protein [Serratia rhizosphaerae]|uniref:Virulence factor n=1 Tax=Serratia rhizosphaerae TaxID=2597702 RepID=A0ABX6GTG9_9GAMM|nr:virulence factor SrfC family protein [Serratia rhizosphaerae]QHA89494.1 virulence factor [Serratia rhizosphaerae]